MLRSFEVPVIFITAYPERFLTGERPEPAFLIAKPFQPATVSAVLSQALFFERNAKRRERRGELAGTHAFTGKRVANTTATSIVTEQPMGVSISRTAKCDA